MSTKTFAGIQAFSKIADDVRKTTLKACINTVNIQAATARKNAVANIQKNFTLRNSFTTRSVTYTQSKGAKSYKDVEASVGALKKADYLERQEKGGIRRSSTGSNLAIPTTSSRGGNNAATVRQRYRYSQIAGNIVKGSKASHGGQRGSLVAKAYIAHRTGKFLRMGTNIFQVTSFRKQKSGKVKFNMKHLYNFDHKTTLTPSDPWLQPATITPASQGQAIFNSQMKKL